MHRFLASTTTVALATLAFGGGALAQTAEQHPEQAPAEQQVQPQAQQQEVQQQPQAGQEMAAQEIAEGCLQDLTELTRQMEQEAFWIAGWGPAGFQGYGWGAGAPMAVPTAPGAGTGMASAPGTPEAGAAPAPGEPAGLAAEPGMAPGPGMAPAPAAGATAAITSPRVQASVLHEAARVLAHQGDAEGCDFLVGRLAQTFEGYVAALRDAGVDPTEVATWRQEQLVLAEPVAEAEDFVAISLDDLTGTDVRNPRDVSLGSVNDLVIDPETGEPIYVILARGGFLGLGADHVAVPWEEFQVTPGFATTPGFFALVLDRSETEIEGAPQVDPDTLRHPQLMQEQRATIDEYWGQPG